MWRMYMRNHSLKGCSFLGLPAFYHLGDKYLSKKQKDMPGETGKLVNHKVVGLRFLLFFFLFIEEDKGMCIDRNT